MAGILLCQRVKASVVKVVVVVAIAAIVVAVVVIVIAVVVVVVAIVIVVVILFCWLCGISINFIKYSIVVMTGFWFGFAVFILRAKSHADRF